MGTMSKQRQVNSQAVEQAKKKNDDENTNVDKEVEAIEQVDATLDYILDYVDDENKSQSEIEDQDTGLVNVDKTLKKLKGEKKKIQAKFVKKEQVSKVQTPVEAK